MQKASRFHRAKHSIEDYFHFSRHEAKWSTEVLAGTSTFASLVYIFIVTPAILAIAGMDMASVLYASIIISATSTIAMGLIGRLPFALAPGLEMSTYVTFTVVGLLGFGWQQALGMILVSSLLFMILSIGKVRQSLIDQVPRKLKHCITFAIGLFLVVVSADLLGFFDYQSGRIQVRSIDFDMTFYSIVGGLIVIAALDRLGFPGAILMGIVVCSFAQIFSAGAVSLDPTPHSIRLENAWAVRKLDWSSILLSFQAMMVVFTLFLIDFYGSVAKFIGLLEGKSMDADLRERAPAALSLDGIATFIGSLLGVTSITTFVESGVGINVGGRTGVTAIVCGLLMALVLLMTPYILMIPVTATVPALLFIGYQIMKTLPIGSRPEDRLDYIDWSILAVMAISVVYDFSLYIALVTGFAGYSAKNILRVLSKKVEFSEVRLNWLLIVSGGILALFLILGWWLGINRV